MSSYFVLEVAFPGGHFPVLKRMLPLFSAHKECGRMLYGYLKVDRRGVDQSWYDPTAKTQTDRTLLLSVQTLVPSECTRTLVTECARCDVPGDFSALIEGAEMFDGEQIGTLLRECAAALLLARHWPTDYNAAYAVVCALTGALMRQEGWDIFRTQRLIQAICDQTSDPHMERWLPIIQKTWVRLVAGDSNLPGFRRFTLIYSEHGFDLQQALCHWLLLSRRPEYRPAQPTPSVTSRQWDALGTTAGGPIHLDPGTFEKLKAIAGDKTPEEVLAGLIEREFDRVGMPCPR